MRHCILKETNWKTVKNSNYDVAVLPWGATEAHNYHLPYGTDAIETEYIAEKAAQAAWSNGTKVIVLPVVSFGVNTTQLDIPLTISLMPSTQMSILKDVISSLITHNIRKIVILNGHGGNDFKQMIRELYLLFPKTFISQLNWYSIGDLKNYFDDTGEHAAECETSIMMKIAPELVLPLSEAGDGKAKRLRFDAAKEGWVWAPRQWIKISKDTGIGNPAKASVDKGEKYLNDVIFNISSFLSDLAKADLEDLYS